MRAEAPSQPRKPQRTPGPQELPEGAVVCGMAGLVLSIQVKVGDIVARAM